MKYDYHEPGDYDEERLREPEDRKRPGEMIVYYLSNIFMPALMGGLAAFVVFIFLPTLVLALVGGSGSRNAIINRTLDQMSRDLGKLASGDFSNIKLWAVPMFAFLVISFVKILNADQRH